MSDETLLTENEILNEEENDIELSNDETPQEEIPQDELPQEEIPQDELPQEEISEETRLKTEQVFQMVCHFFSEDKEVEFLMSIYNLLFVNSYYVNSLFNRILNVASFLSNRIKYVRYFMNTLHPQRVQIQNVEALIICEILRLQIPNYQINYQINFDENEDMTKILKPNSEFQKLLKGEKVNYFDIGEQDRELALRISKYF